jgi:hypothetical protein
VSGGRLGARFAALFPHNLSAAHEKWASLSACGMKFWCRCRPWWRRALWRGFETCSFRLNAIWRQMGDLLEICTLMLYSKVPWYDEALIIYKKTLCLGMCNLDHFFIWFGRNFVIENGHRFCRFLFLPVFTHLIFWSEGNYFQILYVSRLDIHTSYVVQNR